MHVFLSFFFLSFFRKKNQSVNLFYYDKYAISTCVLCTCVRIILNIINKICESVMYIVLMLKKKEVRVCKHVH